MTTHLHLAADSDALHLDPRIQRAIRVVLADDHELMRRSLRRLLDADERVEVLSDVADLHSVIRDVHRYLPSVLVLDLRMPGGSSIDVIRQLREDLPSTEIVVLTMNDNPELAQHALDAGAVGFVLKQCADTELPEAVRCAVRREEYVSPRIVARLDATRRQVTTST